MSFGGGSNPPWQRNSLGNAGQQNAIPSLQSQMINPNLVGFQNFNQNLAMAQHQNVSAAVAAQNNLAILPQLSGNNMNANPIFNQTVQYPNTRSALNQNAFGGGNNNQPQTQQQAQFQQQIHQQQQQQQHQQHQQQQQSGQVCNKIGTVTKISNQCGFIDDEIVFYKNACKGISPKVGDRVLFEAAFSPNAMFKWSASQVQQIVSSGNTNSPSNSRNSSSSQQQQQQQPQQSQTRGLSGYNAVPPPNAYAGGFERSAATTPSSSRSNHSRAISPHSKRSPERSNRSQNTSSRVSRSRDDDEAEERRRRRDRDREREKDRTKEKREQSVERRDRSPVRRISPKRRRTRPIPRYMVQVPKVSLNIAEADVLELRQRYSNLYIPSDFFYSHIRWSESFPPHAPFSLQKPCAFHIFNKSVLPLEPNDAEYDPADADNSFSAKVMLMGVPPMTEIYRKCFATADEKDRVDFVHPTRVINFLVGVLGKNETMAIGGAWSPSLDGANPGGDPSVLIRTAIRTCKALTGIDLSPCTQWYRFVELYYRRKGRNDPVKTQTVVIFLPDVRSCVPTRIEWDELNAKYKRHFETSKKKSAADADSNNSNGDGGDTVSAENFDDSSVKANVSSKDDLSNNGDAVHVTNKSDKPKSTANEVNRGEVTDGEVATPNTNEKEVIKDPPIDKLEPTHYSELDVKSLKMSCLRHELEVRNLSSKGLKPQLIARLTKALKVEENKANEDETAISASAEPESAVKENTAEALDENVNSNDGMDIDMADIVVIDEYDSTKADVKSDDVSKKDSQKRDERELRWMERRYRLPETPQILVHPSKSRTLDKFTCEVMSLSILLDYRPEDTKKHCFEVSLFAELFNEMLMRDFGFNIYRALYSLPSVEPIPEKESKSKDSKRDKDETGDEDEPREKRKRQDDDSNGLGAAVGDSNSTKKDGAESASNGDKNRDKERRERRVSRRDEESGGEDEHETKKLVTVDPGLLLSFVYFDQTHCGYIFSNHIEEMFHALGLRLTRADTKKIVGKVAPRSLFYRKLTDKPKDEAKLEGKVDEDNWTKSKIEDIGKGNNKYLPVFQKITVNEAEENAIATVTKTLDAVDASLKVNGEDDEKQKTADVQMVLYKGALVDIEKLLYQMQRSEKAREETELRLIELKKINQEYETKSTKAKDKIKDLQSDLKGCNRKLGDAETNLTSVNKKYSEYHSILASIHDKVTPIFVKAERNASSSRDKEKREHRDRDEKERNDSSKVSKEKEVAKVENKSDEK